MEFDILPPPPELAATIHAFYRFRSDERQIEGVERADLGSVRFLLRGSGGYQFADGRVERSYLANLQGPGSMAMQFRVRGPVECFGFVLHPTAWRGLIGRSASVHANHVTDLSSIWGPTTTVLADAFQAATSLGEMIDIVTPVLVRRLRPVSPTHRMVLDRFGAWLIEGTGDLEALNVACGLSPRHITRLTNYYHGGPPTLLDRKARATRTAIQLWQGAELATVVGRFYDQSHMIRELRHFIGYTPQAIKRNVDPIFAASFARALIEGLGPLPEIARG